MINGLTIEDIPQVVKIHKEQLPGFLAELGEGFLTKFYEVSLSIPEIFTLVEKEDEQVLGIASAVTKVKGLYIKLLSKDLLSFIWLLLNNFITHPENIVKAIRTLTYPGLSDDIPEILTIAVKRDFQRRGIGQKLFRKITHEFKKRSFKKFRVCTYDKLSANIFYKKIGCEFEKSFEFLGEKMNYYSYKIKD